MTLLEALEKGVVTFLKKLVFDNYFTSAQKSILQTSTVVMSVNTVSTSAPILVSQKDKVLQVNIASSFSVVTLNAQGSNDGANWELLNSFASSDAVINNDPFRFIRGVITAITGSATLAFNKVMVKKTKDDTIAGGTLSSEELRFYLANGTLWKLTDTSFNIGEWCLFIDTTGSPEWSQVNLPIIDAGTTETIFYDDGSIITNENELKDGTIDIIADTIAFTVGQ